MMGAEITNKNGEKVPMLTMETSNAKLNKAQQEIFKRQEKRKEATGVTGANLGEQAGGASVNNKTKLKGIIASSKLDEETARESGRFQNSFDSSPFRAFPKMAKPMQVSPPRAMKADANKRMLFSIVLGF